MVCSLVVEGDVLLVVGCEDKVVEEDGSKSNIINLSRQEKKNRWTFCKHKLIRKCIRSSPFGRCKGLLDYMIVARGRCGWKIRG